MQLTGFDERYPRQLSGGQQQRVALARALAMEPDVLLLDEPLSNLDAKLRQEVRVEIRELQRKLGLTTIMVTHDQEEALTMADRLVVMEKGKVRQIGTQRELYEQPADRFVAGFIGRSAFLDGADRRRRAASVSKGGLDIACTAATGDGRRDAGAAAGAHRGRRRGAKGSPTGSRHGSSTRPISARCSTSHVRLSEQDRMLLQIPNRQGVAEPQAGRDDHDRLGRRRRARLSARALNSRSRRPTGEIPS